MVLWTKAMRIFALLYAIITWGIPSQSGEINLQHTPPLAMSIPIAIYSKLHIIKLAMLQ